MYLDGLDGIDIGTLGPVPQGPPPGFNISLPPLPDMVNNPPHYTKHPSGVECIEITRHMNFNLGNALKYIWRSGQKGSAVQDLEKAIFYLKDEIKRLSG